ncbi:methyltransferase domain-containing protein [Microvirga terrae]|uniref:Methyltransferase domain-containing protein n=1 Tax=Microvirga terrae TaxID=2740529 RepID=A0ABY5RQW4_9HYPH|nr:methyltransferase domain-containing protein [Microvirga terrae]UVF18354.1 methyltransferase domain-containing protein [Microvirga terrae]
MDHDLNKSYRLAQGVWLPLTDDVSAADFTYSDGEEVERRIYDAIAGASDRSLFSRELFSHINDWASKYHLSPVRSNLLRPLEDALKGSILELGAGCGAITRYLGEIGAAVTAVEGSFARARIARERTADLTNVTVVCDRIENFTTGSKFKVVTLIGVLEYARAFAPYKGFTERDMLSHALSHLEDDGFLILAIENQLGMKYFAGAKEDHVSVPYFGVNDSYDAGSAVTFGKAELQQLLSDAGLSYQHVFIPLPDYKLPVTVLSPEGSVPGGAFDAEAQILQSVLADPQRPMTPFFSLERALAVSYRNGLIQDHAGSFLVIASRTESGLKPITAPGKLAWHFSLDRTPAFMKRAIFTTDGDDRIVVKRSRLSNAASPDTLIVNHAEDEIYICGENWWVALSRLVNHPDWSVGTLGEWAKPWVSLLAKEAGSSGLTINPNETIDGALFDATPLNAVMDKGELHFFDQEWHIKEDIEIGFILFRGLRDSIIRITSCAAPLAGTPTNVVNLILDVLAYNGVSLTESDIKRYQQLEWRVQRWVQGEPDEHPSDDSLPDLANWVLNIRPTIADFNEISGENARLSVAMNQLISEKHALLGERDALIAEKNTLTVSVSTLSSENIRLAQRVSKRQEEIKRQAERLKRQKSEIQALHASTPWKLLQLARRVDERSPVASKAARWIFRSAGSALRKIRKPSR